MIPGKALQVRSRSQIHAPFLAGRGHEKIAPGGKCLLTHILETPTRIFPREGDDSVPSPILTRVKICGCRSRAPFARLADFVRTGASFALYFAVTCTPHY